MIAARLLLDTNIVSYLLRDAPLAAEYEALIDGRPAGITSMSIAELHAGAAKDKWGMARVWQLDAFLGDFSYVPGGKEIAFLAGHLFAHRQRIGRSMEWPDVWIAATALWQEVPLVTHDRDYERIPGLKVLTLHEDWHVAEPRLRYGRTAPWGGMHAPPDLVMPSRLN